MKLTQKIHTRGKKYSSTRFRKGNVGEILRLNASVSNHTNKKIKYRIAVTLLPTHYLACPDATNLRLSPPLYGPAGFESATGASNV